MGHAVPSFTSNLLSDLDSKEIVADDIETIKNCAGLAYAGAVSFILAELNAHRCFSMTAGAESVRDELFLVIKQ